MSYASHVRAAVTARPLILPLSGTLTAATYLTTSNGYSRQFGAGSMTPDAFPAFYQMESFTDSSSVGVVSISGFTRDPGQTGAFTTATYNGVSRTAAAATNYSYSNGTAIWSWSGSPFGMGASVGVARAFSIT